MWRENNYRPTSIWNYKQKLLTEITSCLASSRPWVKVLQIYNLIFNQSNKYFKYQTQSNNVLRKYYMRIMHLCIYKEGTSKHQKLLHE
jgi:hypothetical protein